MSKFLVVSEKLIISLGGGLEGMAHREYLWYFNHSCYRENHATLQMEKPTHQKAPRHTVGALA
jgi:hypothetical protein